MYKLLIFILVTTFQTGFATHLMRVGEANFNIEIMDTDEKVRKGLSSYPELSHGSGIVFFYRERNRPHFWMKGVNYPIDIIWIKDNRVVQITSNIPPPRLGQSDARLPRYYSHKAIDTVLEINAGEAQLKGIKVGDQVEIHQF